MKNRKKVIIVEHSPIIVAGLKTLLEESLDFQIVSVVDDLDSVQEQLFLRSPDIILLNPFLVDYSKRFSLRLFFRETPDVFIVALISGFVSQNILKQYHGFITLEDDSLKIESVLRSIVLPAKETNVQELNYEMSDREIAVLKLVAKGLTNRDIADTLNISIHTVISHRKNISRKTGIKSVSGLTVYAMLNNLIEG